MGSVGQRYPLQYLFIMSIIHFDLQGEATVQQSQPQKIIGSSTDARYWQYSYKVNKKDLFIFFLLKYFQYMSNFAGIKF